MTLCTTCKLALISSIPSGVMFSKTTLSIPTIPPFLGFLINFFQWKKTHFTCIFFWNFFNHLNLSSSSSSYSSTTSSYFFNIVCDGCLETLCTRIFFFFLLLSRKRPIFFIKGMKYKDFPGGHSSYYFSCPSTLNFGIIMALIC